MVESSLQQCTGHCN